MNHDLFLDNDEFILRRDSDTFTEYAPSIKV